MKEFRELMDVPESYTTRDITKRIIVPSVDKLLKLKEFHFLRYKYSYKGKKAIRIIFTWHPETIPHASEPASVINSPSTLDLLREKQKKDPFHYETEGESNEIPGMPGYKFGEEDIVDERSDEFPF
jgi:hypothetical protein